MARSSAMRAGKLHLRIIVDQPTTTIDAGEQVVGFAQYATVYGAIEPLRGHEAVLARADLAEMDTRIRLRYSPRLDAMTTKWRLRFRTATYDIKSIAPINYRDREVELICFSGLNLG